MKIGEAFSSVVLFTKTDNDETTFETNLLMHPVVPRKIHRTIPVMEFFFSKDAGLKPASLPKFSTTDVSAVIL